MIIDISQFQGIPDFKELKRHGVTAVYIKATEGQTFVSPTFHEQWGKAGEAKLIRGTYHFGRQDVHPSAGAEQQIKALSVLPLGHGYPGCAYHDNPGTPDTEEWDLGLPGGHHARASSGAVQEARHYVATMRALPGRHGHAWKKGELRPVLDFEVGTPDHHYSPWRDAFFQTVRKLTSHYTILYTFPAFNTWRHPPRWAHQLWIADFRGRKTPEVPGGYNAYDLWQYTSHGHVPGVNGNVDLSKLRPRTRVDHLRCAVSG